jgi:hypothetical protein
MKILLFLCAHLASCLCIGQSVTIENTWKPGSKTVYVGLNNILILRGHVESITSIQSEKAHTIRKGDSLILQPTQAGPLEIILKTADQPISFEFNAEYLPRPPRLIVTGDSIERKNLTKDAILKATFSLLGEKSGVKFYEDYIITAMIIHINNKSYLSVSNTLSNETKQAIADLKSGSIIQIAEVTTRSKSGGKGLIFRTNQSFKII